MGMPCTLTFLFILLFFVFPHLGFAVRVRCLCVRYVDALTEQFICWFIRFTVDNLSVCTYTSCHCLVASICILNSLNYEFLSVTIGIHILLLRCWYTPQDYAFYMSIFWLIFKQSVSLTFEIFMKVQVFWDVRPWWLVIN
jgi:hypothetical protein